MTQRYQAKSMKIIFAAIFSVFLVLYSGRVECTASSTPASFSQIVSPLLPAVVNISTTSEITKDRSGLEAPNIPEGHPLYDFFKQYEERFQRPHKATSLGSGFIIDAKGYIVTSNHVIEGADEITVTLHSDSTTQHKAKVIGKDPRTDLALLKITVDKDLPYVEWGDSNKAKVGDRIIAIGNPFGLNSTVTTGIISTIARDISTRSQQLASADYVSNFLQTDASINMGNSGGPMFNIEGKVIGINTAILSPSGGNIGIGFAIPSSLAKSVIDQLRKWGRTRRGWLGVRIQTVTQEIAEALGLKKAQGALISTVTEDSPATKAGLKPKDIILTFNGKHIKTSRELPRIVGETPISKKVPIEVWRKNKKVKLEVVVGEFERAEEDGLIPSNNKKTSEEKKKENEVFLGLQLKELTPQYRSQLNLEKDVKGVLIRRVYAGSEAYEKGIRSGDLIVEFGNEKVTSASKVIALGKKMIKEKKKHVLLLIRRGADLRYMTLKLNEKEK